MAETDTAVQEKENQTTDDSKKQTQSVEFTEATEGQATGPGGGIDILLDMDIPVTASIGHTEITVRQLLQLGPGSILKLDKSIDEPIDLYLKDIMFANGSVVVVDGCFAVKINQIFGAELQKSEVT